MKKTLIALTLAAAACSAPTMANQISWNQVSVGYNNTDVDDTSLSLDGPSFRATAEVTPNIYVEARYDTLEDEVDVGGAEPVTVSFDYVQVGVGYAYEVSSQLDLYGAVSYREGKAKVQGVSAKVDGYGVDAGLRYAVTRDFEVGVFIDHTRFDDGDDGTDSATAFGGEARLKLASQFAVQARLSRSSDERQVFLGGTFYF